MLVEEETNGEDKGLLSNELAIANCENESSKEPSKLINSKNLTEGGKIGKIERKEHSKLATDTINGTEGFENKTCEGKGKVAVVNATTKKPTSSQILHLPFMKGKTIMIRLKN